MITAVRNAARPHEVPYIFGGDGAVLCVPEPAAAAAMEALGATIAMARDSFGLELRGCAVPVTWLRERGLDVMVARHRVSPHYVQGALYGGGAEYAELQLKAGRLPAEWVARPDPVARADFSGLECRWQKVPSPAAETVAVIVSATTPERQALLAYEWIMERVAAIYGDPGRCRPVAEAGLRVARGRALDDEALVRSWPASAVRRLRAKLRLRVVTALGSVLLALGVRTRDADWGRYRSELVANTDFRKFDGTIRFVVSGTALQRETLRTFLERLRVSGIIRYGIHVSDAALVTCLVERRMGAHFHFVDATGGGYAAAAAHMKATESGTDAPVAPSPGRAPSLT